MLGEPQHAARDGGPSYRASFELYLHEMRGDVWTIETKDRNFAEIEMFGQYKGKLPKKICIGAVSHRSLQADRPEDVAASIRTALAHIAPEQLIVSSDCGFGRQGANREIAFYKASAIAQGCNIVRAELGLGPPTCPPPTPRCRSISSRSHRAGRALPPEAETTEFRGLIVRLRQLLRSED